MRVVLLLLALAGCSRPLPPPAGTLGTFAPAPDILSDPALRALDDPEAGLRAVYAERDEAQRHAVEVQVRTAERAVVLVSLTGLYDDSIRDERVRLVYERATETAWILTEAGRQVRCRDGRGHAGWGPRPCV